MEPKADIRIVVDPVSSMACTRCGGQIDTSSHEPFSPVACPACGAEQVVSARFGPFLLLNLINAGGMGCVYLAKDESLGRLVAIKVMLRSLGEDATFVENFRREAQAAARLNHPNIAQIYSFGQEHNQPYIVMELVNGKRFDKLIAENEVLDPAFVLKIGIDIAEGLKAADEIGLIHGDIKPENILLDEKMNAKLVDFGIATFGADKHGAEGVWGTPYYIAPEKVRRQKVDARSDIFSLGATLYHALSGQPPFDGPTPADVVKARLEGSARPLCEIRPEIGPAMEAIVGRMLQNPPALRYPTYVSLLADLRSELDKLGPPGGRSASQRTRRLMIKKKGSGPPTERRDGAAPGDAANAGKPPSMERLTIRKGVVGRVFLAKDHEKTAEERERAARAVRTAIRRILAVTVGLILIGAAVTVGWLWQMQQRVAEGARQIDRQRELMFQNQVGNAEAVHKRVRTAAAEVLRISVVLRPYVESAEKMASSVFGQTLAEVASSQEAGAAAPQNAAGEQPPPDVLMKQELAGRLARVSQDAQLFALKGVLAREVEAAADETLKNASANTNAQAVAEHVAVLNAYLTAVRPLKEEMGALVASVDKNLKRAQELKRSIDHELAARKQEKERLAKEEARKVLVADEQSRVSATRDACKPMLDAMNCMEAVRVASNCLARLQTREAIDAARALVERAQRLEEMKTFLIQSINAQPFRWGWHRGGSVYEDIIGADAEAVKIRTGVVTWPRISAPQCMRILEHYLQSGSIVRPSASARHYLAMAIWMDARSDAASASACVTKALAALPSIQRDVDRLLPPKSETPPPSETLPAAETTNDAGQVQGGT